MNARVSADDPARLFGKRVRELRTRRGLRLSDVADELGVTKSAIVYWENGRTFPRPRTLTSLASLLGTRVEFLLTGEERGEAMPTPTGKPPLSAAEIIIQARKDIARALGLHLAKVRVEID
jgi:transcriptional regulator with XRE-family HTH domain